MDFAIDLYNHGFLDGALEHFIAIYNNERTPKEYKAEALYLMGEISYEKKDFDNAFADWSNFKQKYPDHKLNETIPDKLANIKQARLKEKNYSISALDIANDYYRHDLNLIAKEKFLSIYHDPGSSVDEKAKALYIVGQIIFEEGDYSLALEDWELLITKFPDSEYAKQIAKIYSQISDIVTFDSDRNSISLIARAYLQNGDFWSSADREFTIDSSWMPSVEIAVKWYDKVLKEFPNTPSAEVAYRRKLFALLGSSNSDDNQKAFGLKENFKKYIPVVLQTFSGFEKDFPKSAYMQGLRYQIAQAYWTEGYTKSAKTWLKKIITCGDGKETFYTETAKARLKNLKF
jgi:TolA-binding protein